MITNSFKAVSRDISVYLRYYEVDEKSKEKVFERSNEEKQKVRYILFIL